MRFRGRLRGRFRFWGEGDIPLKRKRLEWGTRQITLEWATRRSAKELPAFGIV
jgi:hypothetical protein